MIAWESVLAAERPRLFALAYRLLGSASLADDVLQEAWLRVREHDAVDSPGAFLTTVVTRLCLDELRSARRKREAYVGPWLPEPVLDAAVSALPSSRADAIETASMGFLLLLERLSPLERAVFVLRELFDYDFETIALVLGRSQPTCRKLLERARRHVSVPRPRASHQGRVVDAFVRALLAGDAAAMESLLAEDVVSVADGGGRPGVARRPIEGRVEVARYLLGLLRKRDPRARFARIDHVSGRPAVATRIGDELVALLVFEPEDDRIVGLRIVVAEEKLRWIGRALARSP